MTIPYANLPARHQFPLWAFFVWTFLGAVALSTMMGLPPKDWGYWPQFVSLRILLTLVIVPMVGLVTGSPWRALFTCVAVILFCDTVLCAFAFTFNNDLRMNAGLASNILLICTFIICPIATLRSNSRAFIWGSAMTIGLPAICVGMGLVLVTWNGAKPGVGLAQAVVVVFSLLLFLTMAIAIPAILCAVYLLELLITQIRSRQDSGRPSSREALIAEQHNTA